ncbi:MAG: exodeoxyribonuclease VII large subunit [Candidatus Nanohaloarchaea archaeon]
MEPEKVRVDEIKTSMVGDVVGVSGEVANYSYYGGNSFFQLKDGNSSIKAVQFDSEKRLEEGKEVRVKGELAIYKGKMEIIVDSVEKK